MITSATSSGMPQQQTKTFTVQIMGDRSGSGSRAVGSTTMSPRQSSRGGSPKPSKKFSVRGGSKMGKHSFSPNSFNSPSFTITAYLPHDGGKRLRVRKKSLCVLFFFFFFFFFFLSLIFGKPVLSVWLSHYGSVHNGYFSLGHPHLLMLYCDCCFSIEALDYLPLV